jgi:hypothetical protein
MRRHSFFSSFFAPFLPVLRSHLCSDDSILLVVHEASHTAALHCALRGLDSLDSFDRLRRTDCTDCSGTLPFSLFLFPSAFVCFCSSADCLCSLFVLLPLLSVLCCLLSCAVCSAWVPAARLSSLNYGPCSHVQQHHAHADSLRCRLVLLSSLPQLAAASDTSPLRSAAQGRLPVPFPQRREGCYPLAFFHRQRTGREKGTSDTKGGNVDRVLLSLARLRLASLFACSPRLAPVER